MSELSCDTPFIGQIGTLDLVRNHTYIVLRIHSTLTGCDSWDALHYMYEAGPAEIVNWMAVAVARPRH